MKNAILFIFVMLYFSGCSQKKKTVNNFQEFNQTLVKKKGNQLVLKRVVTDSRCPQGVNCIWAGEIEIVVSVYKDNIFIKDENILLSPKLHKENLAWFSTYFPKQKIKELAVLPYPKNDKKINPKDYFVKIYF